MCGIAGYATAGRTAATENATRLMMDRMARRGPDSTGLANWPGVSLGHRRLAIIDLSEGGHQPMLSDDGQVGLVFNGCIYNFLELRQELQQRGHCFRSQSDTEVLLRGYLEWGVQALAPRLRGMFAFAIWDQPRRTLSLVCDRLGVKPLVYAARNGEIAFASTVAAVRAAGFGGEIDAQAVLEYLEFGYVSDDRAIYEGIAKLPPATIAQWTGGQLRQSRYWDTPEIDEASRITFEEAVEETERILVDAVRVRLVSDVPLAVLLSGGIDSALVCWAMREKNANIRAFTVSAAGDPSDESAAAAHTAKLLGIPHEIVGIPKSDFSLEEMTEAYSEPFSCQSAQGMLWVSRAIKPAATVLLTGDGGDDVFLGYPFFRNAWMAQKLARRLPAGAAAAWRGLRGLLPAKGAIQRMRHFLNYATGGLGEYIRAHNGLPYYEQRSLLGERLAGKYLPLRRIPASQQSARRLLSEAFTYHRRVHFTSEFMPKVDGATMHYSLEARSPFLDHRLWDFAAELPPELRFHGGALKAILREIARRRISPEVAFRQKQGFTVPVERWSAKGWSGMLERLAGDTNLEREGWIRRGALRDSIQEALAGRQVPVQLWHLLVLEHWLAAHRNGRCG